MRIFYHGTSMENTESILKNGFDSTMTEMTWTCSDESSIYVVSDDMEEECEGETIRRAIEAATITAAKLFSKSRNIGVFEFRISDKIVKKLEDCCYIQEDFSTGDREPYCYEIDAKELNKMILSGEIKCILHIYKGYMYYMSLVYLFGIKDSQFMDMPEELETALNDLSDSSPLFELWESSFDYMEEIESKKVKFTKPLSECKKAASF